VRGVNEEVVPDVRLTRSRDGSNGKAYFTFEDPQVLKEDKLEILGMYMVDEEGELVARDVNAKFVNGQAVALEASYTMKPPRTGIVSFDLWIGTPNPMAWD
jgi:photosystem II 13kDa protein